jgi:hypothetical protein
MVCFFDATEYATEHSPSCQLFVVSAMKKTLKRLVWLAAILLGAWWIFTQQRTLLTMAPTAE